VRPGSVRFPTDPAHNCYSRYCSTKAACNSQQKFTSWECYDPRDNDAQLNQTRWEITYTLETVWGGTPTDPLVRRMISTGALK
jgi:hypothetical protein